MSSTNMPAGDLVGQLVEEILIRLPVKPLLRFRCVAKSWRALIDSSNFTKLHLSTNSNSKYYNLVGIEDESSNEELDEESIDGKNLELGEVDVINWSNRVLDSDHCSEPVPFQSLKLPFSSPYVKVIGSCDGLIAFATLELEEIILVNPSTREYQHLPPYSEEVGHADIGLGYDCFADEYKLVVIPFQYNAERGAEINICGSKSKTWRQIHFYSNYICYRSSCKYTNGAIHWIVGPPRRPREFPMVNRFQILALDLVTEKFEVADYDGQLFGCPTSFELEVVGGCLCLCSRFPKDGLSKMEVWMMKEYGVKESWCKLMSFKDMIKPLALSVCGRGLLFSTDIWWSYCKCSQKCTCNLLWYDLDKGSIECLGWTTLYTFHGCPQSLVRLPEKLCPQSLVRLPEKLC